MNLIFLCILGALRVFAAPSDTIGSRDLNAIRAKFEEVQTAIDAGDVPKAVDLLGVTLRHAEAAGHSYHAGIAYGWRARIESDRGELRKASADLHAAWNAFEKAGANNQAIVALQNKASLDETLGEMQSAELALTTARKFASDHEFPDAGTGLACDLVRLYMRMGNGDAAKKALADALSTKPTTEKLRSRVLMSRARYSGAFGSKAEAMVAYQEAIPSLLTVGDFHEAANAQYNLAGIFFEEKRYEEAASLIEEAVANFTRQGELAGVGMALSLQAWHFIQQDRLDAAEPILRQADKALRESDYVQRLADNDERYAHYWQKRQEPGKAHDSAEKAASAFEKLGAPERAKQLRELFPRQ